MNEIPAAHPSEAYRTRASNAAGVDDSAVTPDVLTGGTRGTAYTAPRDWAEVSAETRLPAGMKGPPASRPAVVSHP